MLKLSLSLFLSFFLVLGSFSLVEVAAAKSPRKIPHAKVRKAKLTKKHTASVKSQKRKAHKVVKQHQQHVNHKKLLTKSKKPKKFLSKNRKIASVTKKKLRHKKVRKNLPKEYGMI